MTKKPAKAAPSASDALLVSSPSMLLSLVGFGLIYFANHRTILSCDRQRELCSLEQQYLLKKGDIEEWSQHENTGMIIDIQFSEESSIERYTPVLTLENGRKLPVSDRPTANLVPVKSLVDSYNQYLKDSSQPRFVKLSSSYAQIVAGALLQILALSWLAMVFFGGRSTKD